MKRRRIIAKGGSRHETRIRASACLLHRPRRSRARRSCRHGQRLGQQDRPHPRRPASLFRAVGAGGGRRQEGLRHRRGRLQGADRMEAQPADRAAREPCGAGLQRLRHLPGRSGRHQLDRHRAEVGRHPVGGARRLHAGPDRRRLLPRHRRLQLGLSRHQGADQGDGRQGQHRPPRRPPRRPQHHAPRQGGARRRSTRPTAP